MADLALVLGGIRSGKSRFAEQLAAACPPVTYLATALAGDEEMARRITEHRQRRPDSWRTIEEPWNIAATVAKKTDDGCLLLECLSLWLTNLLVGISGHPPVDDATIRRAVADLCAEIQSAAGKVVVVSNEVGAGLIPENLLGRRFCDLLGEANQQLAAMATEVYWCVAGVPVKIKASKN